MNELDRLRDRTWSAPPAGFLEAVTAVGKRRQRRLASVTSLMAAAAVLLALQVVPGADSRETLVPARTPQVTGVPAMPEAQQETLPAEALDAEGANGDEGSLGRTATGGGTAVTEDAALLERPTAMGRGGAQQEAPDAGRPAPGDRPAGQTGPGDAYAPMRKYRGQEPSVPNCPVSNNRASACGLDSDADVGATSGGQREVGFHACQDSGRPDARVLKFASEAEVVLTIKDRDGTALWVWRPPRPYRDVPHQDQVAAGECLFWTTSWREVADDGRPLASGVYQLRVEFLGSKTVEVHTNNFTVARS